MGGNYYSCEDFEPWMDTIKSLQGRHNLGRLNSLQIAQLLSPAFNDDVFKPVFGKSYSHLSQEEKSRIYTKLNKCYPNAWIRFGLSTPFVTSAQPNQNQKIWQTYIERANRDSFKNIIAEREKMAKWNERQKKLRKDLREQARKIERRPDKENHTQQYEKRNFGLDECGQLPESYQNHEYGNALFSIEKPCHRRLSSVEQSYILGISDYLLHECGYPSDLKSRSKVTDFLFSHGFTATFGGQWGNSRTGETTKSQLSNSAAAIVGQKTAKVIGCTHHGEKLAADIVKYIERKQQVTPGKPSFVDGCIKYYSGRFSKKKCECAANIGSSVIPDIYDTTFSPETIHKVIELNPLLGSMFTFKCGITRY